MITTDLMATYLANILDVVQVDEALDPTEQAAVGKLCRQLGAEEKDLHAAMEMVAGGGYRPTPVGRFSDKVRNLENMLFLAMVDGDLAPAEKERVLDFARKIHLHQDQVKIILSETRLKVSLQKGTLECGRCGAALTPDSKFCTSCGNQV